LTRLEHPALLHVLDTIDLEDRFGVVTELLPEETLQDRISQQSHFSSQEVITIGIQLGEALAILHNAGFALGGLQAKDVGQRTDGTVVIVEGPPTSDAIGIPARPSDDIGALGELLHCLLVGFRPQIDHQGRYELHPAIPTSLEQLIRRSVDRDSQWSDATALVLSLRSLQQDFDRLPHDVETTQADYLRVERTWLAPAAIIAVLGGLAIITGLFVTRTESAPSLVGDASEVVRLEPEQTILMDSFSDSPADVAPITSRPSSPSSPRQIIGIVDFDPAGDDREEHPEQLELINNGDSSTGWYTERYTTSDFGKLKDGVGLIIQLVLPQHIDQIQISSPTIDWSFEIFASQDSTGAIQSWGEAIARRDETSGTITVPLGGTPAAALLLWITDLGKRLPVGGHRVTISELKVSGRPLFG
jgi:serine/threonine protein kinase